MEHKETPAKSLDIFLDTFSFFDLTGNLKSFRGFFVVIQKLLLRAKKAPGKLN